MVVDLCLLYVWGVGGDGLSVNVYICWLCRVLVQSGNINPDLYCSYCLICLSVWLCCNSHCFYDPFFVRLLVGIVERILHLQLWIIKTMVC